MRNFFYHFYTLLKIPGDDYKCLTGRIAFTIAIISIASASIAQQKKYAFREPKMGSLFHIIIYSTDSLNAASAAAAVYKLIDSLNEIYSDYLPESELNNLCQSKNAGKWIPVSEPLFSILQKALIAGKMSHGSFDITMGPLSRLWRRARSQHKLPAKDSITFFKHLVSNNYISVDTNNRRVRLQKPGMQLDLGGIAKGETAQRAYNRLCGLGFPYSLVDAGGDIVAGDVPPQIKGWKIAINLPESEKVMDLQLILKGKAVATSGDLYQNVELSGRRFSHIIDPVSGYALSDSRNVTVIAENGADADWLATACSILPVEKALKLIQKFPFAEVQIAVLKKNKPYFYRSPGFTFFLKMRNRK